MKIGNREFQVSGHTYVMGILNVTPDSFSDGGKFNNQKAALEHVEEMIAQGADLIDVGGESTRPGYTKITEEEEIARVTAVISAIKKRFDIPVSIDTYKARVASAAIDAGADLINDIWGCRYEKIKAFQNDNHERHASRDGSGSRARSDGENSFAPSSLCLRANKNILRGKSMAEVMAESGVPVCLMHNRFEKKYDNFLEDVKADLRDSISIAMEAGVSGENIILDPGVGFAKTLENNLEIVNKLSQICEMGFPVLLGTSRKSMIGITLDLPVNQREEGTLVTTVLAVQAGCMFVRVHDVEKNIRAIKMMEAIQNEKI